jgi:hypothetical protein
VQPGHGHRRGCPSLRGGQRPGDADVTPPAPVLGADRPRLVVVDELVLTTPLDPYLSLRGLAAYSSCSIRWLRAQLGDPRHPLPCYRLPGGKILVRRSTWDAWLTRYRQVGRAEVTAVVSDVLARVARPGSGRRPHVP